MLKDGRGEPIVLREPIMRVVNGHPCRNCAEEAVAKRGLDPNQPKPELRAYRAGTDGASKPELGVSRPEAGAALGGTLNLYG
jgi:hypothetical protein